MAKRKKSLTLSVYRYNSTGTRPPRYDSFELAGIGGDDQLLDLFELIKQEYDSTFSYRKSCRHGICGSCAVRVEGVPVLACKTNVHELIESYGGSITVDPLGREQVIRDLIIDMDPFWEKYGSVRPYLDGIPKPSGGKAPRDRRISPEKIDRLGNAELCIQCGSCYYVCPVVKVNRRFLGPAALTKAYRFAADARDFSTRRLRIVHEHYAGVWDCAKCLLCVEACPKNIDPFRKITVLHEMGTDRNLNTRSEHYRHARVFNRQVRRTGYINEFFLALNTLRLNMRKMLLRGVLLVFKGKMKFNFLFPRSIKRYELRDLLRKHPKEGGKN